MTKEEYIKDKDNFNDIVLLEEGKHFTLKALTEFLNKEYQVKKSGKPFKVNDVQQYVIRGYVPQHYKKDHMKNGYKIVELRNSKIGLLVYELIEE